jgi:hypothetical protein
MVRRPTAKTKMRGVVPSMQRFLLELDLELRGRSLAVVARLRRGCSRLGRGGSDQLTVPLEGS